MSFQAYIDTIKAKTGKGPEDFLLLARQKGLLEPGTKTGQIVDWLKKDFNLGRGHAMALVVTFNTATMPQQTIAEQIAQHFSGNKTRWRHAYDDFMAKIVAFGPDISVKPGKSYLSLLRNGKKFAIVQVTADQLTIGIKRKSVEPTKRFSAAGSWNTMVTHRVRIAAPEEIDSEVIEWLKQAYLAT